ncbi:MAG: electron transporter RnfE [Ignavibacteria bacterium CG_4_10_14_3_um_filter_37_18]|nr:MAG: electron transporter RnfE [Ignavibacteria bacterium CG_4_10_14_3_um_filter_37_18]
MIIGLVFWAVIIYAIFRLISNLTNRYAEVSRKEETALDILKRRYAKGEIDTEEFTKRKKEL